LVMRHLGEAMVRANLHRLPRLREALVQVVESSEAHQRRRVRRAIEWLIKNAYPLDLWRIQRHAPSRRWSQPVLAFIKHSVLREQIRTLRSPSPRETRA
jgi:hypothetical protein